MSVGKICVCRLLFHVREGEQFGSLDDRRVS